MNYTLIEKSLLEELEEVYRKIYANSGNREVCIEFRAELKKVQDSKVNREALHSLLETTVGKYYVYRNRKVDNDEIIYYKPTEVSGDCIYGDYLRIGFDGIYEETDEKISIEKLTDALIISSQDPRLQLLKEYCYYQDPFEKVFTEITESEYNAAFDRFKQFVKNENNR